jgi:hypothetical protein
LVGRSDFGIIAYGRTIPNGIVTTFVSIATKSNICSSSNA